LVEIKLSLGILIPILQENAVTVCANLLLAFQTTRTSSNVIAVV